MGHEEKDWKRPNVFPLYPHNRKLISNSSGNFRTQSPKRIDCYLVEGHCTCLLARQVQD
jgi:hypothetical protein